MMALYKRNKYPRCWRKVVRVIRRLCGGICEWCGSEPVHSIHHIGTVYANGRPGDKRDKHDLRRENLAGLCFACHDQADNGALSFYARIQARGKARRLQHQALGIGTGLVPLRPILISPAYWYVAARLHYARLRYSKRTGHNAYRSFVAPVIQPHIVDSYLVYL